jgi:hypothetical protein
MLLIVFIVNPTDPAVLVIWYWHLYIMMNGVADVTPTQIFFFHFGLLTHILNLFLVIFTIFHLGISGNNVEIFIRTFMKLVYLNDFRCFSILSKIQFFELKEHLSFMWLNLIIWCLQFF